MDNRRALHLLTQSGVFLPAVVPDLAGGGFYVFSSLKVLGHGETIDAAMWAAKEHWHNNPQRPTYRVEVLNVVTNRGFTIATASSKTYAQRIANALNLYNPNERGV